MRYIISDIHGHYNLFQQMLEKIDFKKEDTLYVLGDMIDRGEEPIAVVRYIMEQPNMQVIIGNHELLMLNALDNVSDEELLEKWYRNGGAITHGQFDNLDETEQIGIKTYLKQLPPYIELEDYLLVHAGIRVEGNDCTWSEVKDNQIIRDLTFIRDEFILYPTITDKKVIFGHTQTRNFGEAGNIYFGKDKIGIDCGVYSRQHGGRLGCLNLDTMKTYYI